MIDEKQIHIAPRAPKTRAPVGLALSGGGARGLAHIGVLKVIEQAGIQVDCVAGSSMGGIIAAAYAAGWTPRALEQEAINMRSVRQLVSLVDPLPPRRGLLAGNRVRAYLARLLGDDLEFSDLQLPLALKAVDLHRGHQVCLRQGKVLDAVMATSAFPGVFAPVEIDGTTLVDGGVLDNLPVEMPREMGADVVIAVDVTPPLDDAGAPPEWSLLPGPAKELYQVVMIMNNAMTGVHLKEAPPDVLISPDLPRGIGIFSGFTQADRIISAGEEAARRTLPALKQALAAS